VSCEVVQDGVQRRVSRTQRRLLAVAQVLCARSRKSGGPERTFLLPFKLHMQLFFTFEKGILHSMATDVPTFNACNVYYAMRT
jgi:hypothetical protein